MRLPHGVHQLSRKRGLGLEEVRKGEVRVRHDQPAARTQNPLELGENRFDVGHVLEQEAGQSDVERPGREPGRGGARLDEAHALRLAEVLTGMRQHRGVEVETCHRPILDVLEEKLRHKPGPAAGLQNGCVLPQPVLLQRTELLGPGQPGLHSQPRELGRHIAEARLADPVRARLALRHVHAESRARRRAPRARGRATPPGGPRGRR